MINFAVSEKFKSICKVFLVFIFFLGLFSYFQFSSFNLISPDDGYYHIKHAFLYKVDGLSIDFPYLEYATLKDRPVDLWLLYHLILIPFTSFPSGQGESIDMIFGIKAATALFAALFFTAFYFILSRLNIRYAVAWTFGLLVVFGTFSFRMFLPRPHILSLLLLMMGFYFLIKNKKKHIFVLAAIYSLAYELSFLLIGIAAIYVLCYRYYYKKWDLGILAYASGGWLLGVLLHFHPINYFYTMYGFFTVLVYRFLGDIPLGMEMYNKLSFSREIILLSGIFIITLCNIFISVIKKRRLTLIEIYVSSLFFLIFPVYLFIGRTIEYLAPFAMLLTAVVINERFPSFYDWLGGKIKGSLTGTYAVYLILLAGGVMGYFFYNYQVSGVSQFKKYPYDKYRLASQWLSDNSNDGDVVFNVDWSDFPQLFFWNSKNHYIIGMDPMSLYLKDKEKYWLWRNISGSGMVCSHKVCESDERSMYEVIKNDFNSKYVFINNYKIKRGSVYLEMSSGANDGFVWNTQGKKNIFEDLVGVLDRDERFELAYRDASFPEIMIYRLKGE